MIIESDKLKEEIKNNDDFQNLELAKKYGCYLLACIWDDLDPADNYEEEEFDEANPFRHLWRRMKGLGCKESKSG